MCPVREIPVYAFDVNPEQVGIYQTINLITDPINPPTSPTEQEASGMTIIDSSAGFGPDTDDAGTKAREKLALAGAVIKRKALRMWMWIKIIAFLAICGLIGFGYYSYEHRIKSYVTDHRPCSASNDDKSWTVTGTRSYSYQNNELFGFRWSEKAAVEEKTELDLGVGSIMVIGAHEGGYWYQLVTPNTTRPVMLKPADLFTFVSNNKVIVTNSETFCK